MRTYNIVDTATGAVLRSEDVEDTMRPAMLAGHEAILTHVDGEPAIIGVPMALTDEQRANLGVLGTAEDGTEFAVGAADPVIAEPAVTEQTDAGTA